MSVTIRRQQRRNLALRMTPSGPEVLVPQHIDPESETVQRFIEEALAKLPEPEPVDQPLTVEGHLLFGTSAGRFYGRSTRGSSKLQAFSFEDREVSTVVDSGVRSHYQTITS